MRAVEAKHGLRPAKRRGGRVESWRTRQVEEPVVTARRILVDPACSHGRGSGAGGVAAFRSRS